MSKHLLASLLAECPNRKLEAWLAMMIYWPIKQVWKSYWEARKLHININTFLHLLHVYARKIYPTNLWVCKFFCKTACDLLLSFKKFIYVGIRGGSYGKVTASCVDKYIYLGNRKWYIYVPVHYTYKILYFFIAYRIILSLQQITGISVKQLLIWRD